MTISDAQREIRLRFAGGCYGQLVSGLLWLGSAALAEWSTPRAAILLLVLGGFLIFPLTEALVRVIGPRVTLSPGNSLPSLGWQVAFVLPLSMLLLVPVARYRLQWFYPGMMVLLGAHYLPFAFLYGMRLFALLAALLVGGGVAIALSGSATLSSGAWLTGVTLLAFAGLGRAAVSRELARAPRGGSTLSTATARRR